MAVSLIQQPTTPNGAYTRLIYVASGSVTTSNPQYQYVMDVYESGSSDRIARLTQTPNPAGTAVFDPSRIFQGELGEDQVWKSSNMVSSVNSSKTFEVRFGEQYGTSVSSSVTVYPDLISNTIDVIPAVVDPNNGISYNWQSGSFLLQGTNVDYELTNDPLLVDNSDRGAGQEIVFKPIGNNDWETVSYLNDGTDYLYYGVLVYRGEEQIFAQDGFPVSYDAATDMVYLGTGPKNLIQAIPALATIFNDNWTHYDVRLVNSVPNVSSTNTYYVNEAIEPTFIYNTTLGGRRLKTYLQPIQDKEKTRFAFINRYGVWDYYTIFNPVKRSSNIEKQSVTLPQVDYSSTTSPYNVNNRGEKTYYIETNDSFTVETPLLDKQLGNWVEELLESPSVYIQKGDSFIPVLITNSSYISNTHQARQKLFQYNIEFMPANQPYGEWESEFVEGICPANFTFEINTNSDEIDSYYQYWQGVNANYTVNGGELPSGSHSWSKNFILPNATTVNLGEMFDTNATVSFNYQYTSSKNDTVINTQSGNDVEGATINSTLNIQGLQSYKGEFNVQQTSFKAIYNQCYNSASTLQLFSSGSGTFPYVITNGDFCYEYATRGGDGSDGEIELLTDYADCPECDAAIFASASLGYRTTGLVCDDIVFSGLTAEEIVCGIEYSTQPISLETFKYRIAEGLQVGSQLFDSNWYPVTSSGNFTYNIVLGPAGFCNSDATGTVTSGSVFTLTSGVITNIDEASQYSVCADLPADYHALSIAYIGSKKEGLYNKGAGRGFMRTYGFQDTIPNICNMNTGQSFTVYSRDAQFQDIGGFHYLTQKLSTQNYTQADSIREFRLNSITPCTYGGYTVNFSPRFNGGCVNSLVDEIPWYWTDYPLGSTAISFNKTDLTSALEYSGSYTYSAYISGAIEIGKQVTYGIDAPILFGTTGSNDWFSIISGSQNLAMLVDNTGTIVDLRDDDALVPPVNTVYEPIGPSFWLNFQPGIGGPFADPLEASKVDVSSPYYINPATNFESIVTGSSKITPDYDFSTCTFGDRALVGFNKYFGVSDIDPNVPYSNGNPRYVIQVDNGGAITYIVDPSTIDPSYWLFEECYTGNTYRTTFTTASAEGLTYDIGDIRTYQVNQPLNTPVYGTIVGSTTSSIGTKTFGDPGLTECPPLYPYLITTASWDNFAYGDQGCSASVVNTVYGDSPIIDQVSVVYTALDFDSRLNSNNDWWGIGYTGSVVADYQIRVDQIGQKIEGSSCQDFVPYISSVDSGSIDFDSFTLYATGSDQSIRSTPETEIQHRGFYVGLDSSSAYNNPIYSGSTVNNFSASIDGLTELTDYYAWAYAANSVTESISNRVTVTTTEEPEPIPDPIKFYMRTVARYLPNYDDPACSLCPATTITNQEVWVSGSFVGESYPDGLVGKRLYTDEALSIPLTLTYSPVPPAAFTIGLTPNGGTDVMVVDGTGASSYTNNVVRSVTVCADCP